MTPLLLDASILIDLRKASALTLLTRLPHELMTTNFVFKELQRFTPEELHKFFPESCKYPIWTPSLFSA